MGRKFLLHACCGPCSTAVVKVLHDQGIEPQLFFSNSNIWPADEYKLRLDTLKAWADAQGIPVFEGRYDPDSWMSGPGSRGQVAQTEEERRERCRLCYRLRFEETARFAKDSGFDTLSTTLSISPYQFSDIIAEELSRACKAYGLECAYKDYSPYYRLSCELSRAEGMYRQNYCGCMFSYAEAEKGRQERREARRRKKLQEDRR